VGSQEGLSSVKLPIKHKSCMAGALGRVGSLCSPCIRVRGLCLGAHLAPGYTCSRCPLHRVSTRSIKQTASHPEESGRGTAERLTPASARLSSLNTGVISASNVTVLTPAPVLPSLLRSVVSRCGRSVTTVAGRMNPLFGSNARIVG
jgi:hypothetical protein